MFIIKTFLNSSSSKDIFILHFRGIRENLDLVEGCLISANVEKQ